MLAHHHSLFSPYDYNAKRKENSDFVLGFLEKPEQEMPAAYYHFLKKPQLQAYFLLEWALAFEQRVQASALAILVAMKM